MMSFLKSEKMTKIIKSVSVVVILALLTKLVLIGADTNKSYLETRKNAICPSLLSISRSARDTLIVMKAETLCNSYVLENLK